MLELSTNIEIGSAGMIIIRQNLSSWLPRTPGQAVGTSEAVYPECSEHGLERRCDRMIWAFVDYTLKYIELCSHRFESIF